MSRPLRPIEVAERWACSNAHVLNRRFNTSPQHHKIKGL